MFDGSFVFKLEFNQYVVRDANHKWLPLKANKKIFEFLKELYNVKYVLHFIFYFIYIFIYVF